MRAVVTMHTHGPNYECARYEYGPSPPKDTLLVVYLVHGISWMLSCLGGRRVVLLRAMC